MPELSWPDDESFSDPTKEEVPRVPIKDHYRNLPDSYVVGSADENQVRFPDALDVLLSIYFKWTYFFDPLNRLARQPLRLLLQRLNAFLTWIDGNGCQAGRAQTPHLQQ